MVEQFNNKTLSANGNSQFQVQAQTTNIDISRNINHQLYINLLDSIDAQELNFELAPHSKLEVLVYSVQVSDTNIKLAFNVNEDATLNVIYVINSSGSNNVEISVNLNQVRAESAVNVVSIASGKTSNQVNVKSNNLSKYTNAQIIQKAVALSGGENIFEATGFIAKDCSKSTNFQESRVLLLDDASKGEASPILLINHHDVEAGHAAGVTRVDEDSLYYLMSRGIDKGSAEKLVTSGFIRPIIDKISNDQLREKILNEVMEEVA